MGMHMHFAYPYA
jgi:hypothetical protein